MSLADAFQGVEAQRRAQVLEATWGHLHIARGTVHKGYMVFAHADYGGSILIIDAEWEGVQGSPWLYDCMLDYACRHSERGKVIRLDGHVRCFKNGRYQIGGKRYKVNLKGKK